MTEDPVKKSTLSLGQATVELTEVLLQQIGQLASLPVVLNYDL